MVYLGHEFVSYDTNGGKHIDGVRLYCGKEVKSDFGAGFSIQRWDKVRKSFTPFTYFLSRKVFESCCNGFELSPGSVISLSFNEFGNCTGFTF